MSAHGEEPLPRVPPAFLELHTDEKLERRRWRWIVAHTLQLPENHPAFDPLFEVSSVASGAGLWLHVDAAMAGSAMLLPECRHLWDGVEAADSISWNPHKWMGTILDTSLFYVRDPEHLVR